MPLSFYVPVWIRNRDRIYGLAVYTKRDLIIRPINALLSSEKEEEEVDVEDEVEEDRDKDECLCLPCFGFHVNRKGFVIVVFVFFVGCWEEDEEDETAAVTISGKIIWVVENRTGNAGNNF